MPFSYNDFTGDGITNAYTFTFSYLDPADLRVTIDGLLVESGWTLTAPDQLTFDAPIESAAALRIYRDTDISGPVVTFRNASTLTAENLNTALLQPLYALQEIQDTYDELEASLEDFLP